MDVEISKLHLEANDLDKQVEQDFPVFSIRPHKTQIKSQYIIRFRQDDEVVLEGTVALSSDGIPPSCICTDSIIFIGCDFYIYLYSLTGKLISSLELATAFYEFQVYLDRVICVCETEIVFYDIQGNFISHEYLDDIITKANITPSGTLQLNLFEGEHILIHIP